MRFATRHSVMPSFRRTPESSLINSLDSGFPPAGDKCRNDGVFAVPAVYAPLHRAGAARLQGQGTQRLLPFAHPSIHRGQP